MSKVDDAIEMLVEKAHKKPVRHEVHTNRGTTYMRGDGAPIPPKPSSAKSPKVDIKSLTFRSGGRFNPSEKITFDSLVRDMQFAYGQAVPDLEANMGEEATWNGKNRGGIFKDTVCDHFDTLAGIDARSLGQYEKRLC